MKTALGRTTCRARGAGRGFTLAELLIVVAIIGLLATLAFVVLSRAIREARATVERQTLVSIRNAVESFKQDFGFLPPLVRDGGPGPRDAALRKPRVWDDGFLRSESNPDLPRYSVNSIPFYLLGTLDAEYDGVDGPGFTEPQPDGSFSKRGREYPPRFDVSVDPARVKTNPADPLDVRYVDRWGRAATSSAGWPAVNPIRYYRWLPSFGPDGRVDQYLTPRAVGDPNVDFSLRDAQYAIVSVGPNGVTDERKPLPTAGSALDNRVDGTQIDTFRTSDDLVEVGR